MAIEPSSGRSRIRLMPGTQGNWTFKTSSNRPKPDGREGRLVCVPRQPGNRGPVVVRHARHFAYAGGVPCFPVGTTGYAWAHQDNQLEEQTLATLRTGQFNKMCMCVFPKDHHFDKNDFTPFSAHRNICW